MRIENLELRSKVTAVCVKTKDPLTESSSGIYIVDKQSSLIPMVSEIMERKSRSVGLIDSTTGKRITSNDRGYQKGRVSYSATDSLFGMEGGDLRVSEEVMFLNFTDAPIAISLPRGHRRIMSPVSPESSFFKEHRGKVIIVEVVTVMNPLYRNDTTGAGYSALNIMDTLKNNGAGYDTETLKHLSSMGIAITKSIKNEKFGEACKSSATLQVINSLTIDHSQLEVMCNGVSINVKEFGIVMSHNELSKLPISDRLKISKNISNEDLKAINNTCMVAYIVNKDSEIGPRFASTAGIVHEITQITDTDQQDGLYMSVMVSGKLSREDYYTFEEMDKSPYIFKDMETARKGMDTRMQATEKLAELERLNKLKDQELKNYELELRKERATREETFKDWEREWEIERKELNAQYEENRRNEENKLDKKKRKREKIAIEEARIASKESEKLRLEMERMDHQHKVELASLRYSTEHMKSGSEETQLSLKTIGAALALGSVVFLAFKKL